MLMPDTEVLQKRLWDNGDPVFRSLAHLSKMQVTHKDGVRTVTCFCGLEVLRSVVPHIRNEHPEIWEAWKSVFVELRNRGWSHKKIMDAFRVNERPLFSWTVIERELRRAEERGEANLQIWEKAKIDEWEPRDFTLERTTVWDFPQRGGWAVHQSDYRGNWPPQLARNLILRYTNKGDLVADLFAGGGTTLIEAWLTGRRSLGIDISPFAIKMTRARLKEMIDKSRDGIEFSLDSGLSPVVCQGDSRDCSRIMREVGWEPGSVALVCAHPPYLDALQYTDDIEGDLSRIRNVDDFCSAMRAIGVEVRKWLKPRGTFALLVGDVRKRGKLVPVGFKLLQEFLSIGYRLADIIIKTQHRDWSTHLWVKHPTLVYLIAHEYLFIFTKPPRTH